MSEALSLYEAESAPGVQPHGSSVGRIEIRLLGPLRVRRADGSLVHPREWRTGKTADLVRLLALHAGHAVPVDTLVDALWPESDPQRGRASLRTAASQVRRVLGHDCLERRFGGVELQGVWVDALAFSALVREVRRLVSSGQPARAVMVAREADALYLADFRAHGDDEGWAVSQRESLANAFSALISDAADAAVELGWMRDAVDFAQRAVALDRFSERGYRALMQGYAGVGESPRALRIYESYRSLLVEELGADPSPRTQALHLELLTATPVTPEDAPFVGRHEELNLLKTVIASLTDRVSAVVRIVGPPGSGKTRLVAEACSGSTVRVVTLSCHPRQGRAVDCVEQLLGGLPAAPGETPEERLRGAIARSQPTVVLIDECERAVTGSAQRAIDVMSTAAGPVLVVLCARTWQRDTTTLLETPSVLLELPPLARDDLAWMADAMLSGAATPQLVAALLDECQGLPGNAVATLRGWSRAGRIVATAAGLVLVPSDEIHLSEHPSTRLAPLLDQLGECDLRVLTLLSVLGGPTDASVVVPLLDDGLGIDHTEHLRARVQKALDRLVDLSVIVPVPKGYIFRDELLRHAVHSWLRPTARRELHQLVAERAFIPAAERVEHWLQAGETQLGRAAALTAAAEAVADARYDDARSHLIQVCSLGAMPETVPGDRIELFERLGDVCAALGRRDEARAAFSVALSVSRTHDLPDVPRLATKRAQVCGSPRMHDGRRHSPSGPAVQPPDELDVDYSADPEMERSLREALELADRGNDPVSQVATRLRLATSVCTPRRWFGRGRMWAQEALSITLDPRLRAKALLALWLPGVLLGDAQLAEGPLEQARQLAERTDDFVLQTRIAVLQCLVAHDLGHADFAARWSVAAAACGPAPDVHWQWVKIRIATERGDLAGAQRAAGHSPGAVGSPLASSLAALASAALQPKLNRPEAAAELLASLIAAQARQGSALLLPEAYARLIVLQTTTDPAAAIDNFDQLDRSVGTGQAFPREQCWRLLARAAIRAAGGRLDRAASAAADAVDVATASGLPFLAAEAESARYSYLAATAAVSDTRTASIG